jgi:predicted MFS family arabinose efflux permease
MVFEKDRIRPLFLVSVAAVISLIGDQTLYVVLPLCHESLDISKLFVGVILSSNRWVRLLTNHVAETLMQRFCAWKLFVAALLFGALATSLYSIGGGILGTILLGRVLWGFCWSVIRRAGVLSSVAASAEGRTGTAVGSYNGMIRAGMAVVLPLCCLLYDQAGFAQAMPLIAAVSLLAVAPALATRNVVRAPARSGTFRTDGKTQNRPPWSMLLSGVAVGMVGRGMLMATLAYILNDDAMIGDRSFSLGGIVLGVATVAALVQAGRNAVISASSPLLGKLLDRFGHARGVLVMFVAGAATLYLAFLAFLSGSAAGVIGLSLLFYLFGTAINISLHARSGRLGGRAYAWQATAEDIGVSIGPLLIWAVFAAVDAPWLAFVLGIGIYSVGAGMSLVSTRQSKARKQDA